MHCVDNSARFEPVAADGGDRNIGESIVRRNDCTPALDLDGRRRNIDEIYLSYGKLHPGGEPRVSIQAR